MLADNLGQKELEHLVSTFTDQPSLPLPHYNVGLNSNGKQTTLHGVGGGGDVNLYLSVSTILSKIVA